MNLATDNLSKSGIFNILCLEESKVALVSQYLRVLTALFCKRYAVKAIQVIVLHTEADARLSLLLI